MMWIGWLIACGLGLAYYRANDENNKARLALVSLQGEIVKLASLWRAEMTARRELEDEYCKTNDGVQAECLAAFGNASEPYWLYSAAYVEDHNEYMFRTNREPWNTALLDSNPAAWAKQLVLYAVGWRSKHDRIER